MRRTALEAKLRALGWFQIARSGKNHTVCVHAKKYRKLVVPDYELIFDSNAEGILADAER